MIYFFNVLVVVNRTNLRVSIIYYTHFFPFYARIFHIIRPEKSSFSPGFYYRINAWRDAMYKPLNINPAGRRTDDCVIRALAKAFGTDWITMYDNIAAEGRRKYDIMQANHVWIGWLERHGFKMFSIPNTCPECYTVRDFCMEHKNGAYILGTGTHVIAVQDGDWFDTFDSGDLIPIYYFRRRNYGV